jgi:hypothetical protein
VVDRPVVGTSVANGDRRHDRATWFAVFNPGSDAAKGFGRVSEADLDFRVARLRTRALEST